MTTVRQMAGGLAVAAMCAAGAVTSLAVAPGDDRAAVVAELGPPSGAVTLPDEERLYYDRGTVRLRGGRVTHVDLISAEELRSRRAAEAAAQAKVAAAQAAQSVRRKAEGEALLRQWLEDPVFRTLSFEEQAARWAQFARRYPEVPVAAYLADVAKRLDEQREREEQGRRITELLFRARQAEQAALAAEQRASRALNPYAISAGGRTTYYVQPWTLYGSPFGSGYAPRRGHGGPYRTPPQTQPARGSSLWPYNFGLESPSVQIGPRQPGMPW
ncbi:MAG: hypothetical protein KJ579_07630 [Verrucomicrobia bacterium]|nr:hypothetical protein [Verrucomicrobiota bacterium]